MRWRRTVWLGLLMAVVALHPARTAHAQASTAQDPNAAFRHLNEEIARYLGIHVDLRAEVPGPIPNSTAQELNDASDMLAIGIQRARPNGRHGDFFDEEATRLIRQRLADALRMPHVAAALAGIDDEKPATIQPGVYLRFPVANEMATMPPSLLKALPPLPDELEYRIVGKDLVLRDVKAAMILDYIVGALERQ